MKGFRFFLAAVAVSVLAAACTSADPVAPELRAPEVPPVLDSTGVSTEGGGMLGGGGRKSSVTAPGVLFPAY